MLIHFFKVIFRYLYRKVFFTALNVAGLSLGLACCIVIFLFVTNELSYDKFHRDGDNIYRVLRQSEINQMPYDIGITAAPFGPALQQDFPDEIKSVTRVLTFGGLFTYKDQAFMENKLLLADSNFFRFFSFPLVAGDGSSVLRNANSLVISERLAQKYFSNEDPVGKMIRLDDQYDMMITGVMTRPPGNSHLQFDAVGSLNIAEEEDWFDDWWGNAFFTFIKLNDTQDAGKLNARFPAFMEKYFGEDFEKAANRINLKLEPLHDIYFNKDTRYENNVVHGDRRYVNIFVSIGIVLLLLASINYINLATAQSSSRMKEVGIRKTLGSAQHAIAFQFLSESFFLCLLSALMATGIAQSAIPLLNSQFGLTIPGIFSTSWVWTFVVALVFVLSIASGAYPAFLLSSFKPVSVLKGRLSEKVHYAFVRKALVIFQFTVSGFMIISTLFIGEQLSFMRQKDLGFKADQVMVINLNNGSINRERLAFKEALLHESSFVSASLSSGYPGGFYDATTVKLEGTEHDMRMRTLWTDTEYAHTMGLTMKAGRFFSKDFPADSSNAVILNETAVKQLGWSPEEAIGRRLMLTFFDSTYKEVIGVIQDYHYTSVKQKIEPLVISCIQDRGILLLRIAGSDLPTAVSDLEKVWERYETGFPLNFQFLDEVVDRLYTTETVQGKVFTLFSLISVLIACLGIFGLGTYLASQRRKEIGVRKVLGATTQQVSGLLMKDLVMLVLIANLVSIPVVYWAMNRWLENFAYRITLHPVIFVVGSGAVLLLACLITGINASRAALENPVHSLRTE